MKSSTDVNVSGLLHDAARGMAQQMVLWGYDVRHPAGNALVRCGMDRRKSPGLTGTSCYSMPWEDGRIELHGAVASWVCERHEPGCVFFRDRRRIEQWLEKTPPIPGRGCGAHAPAEERWQAFRPLLRWLIFYESRVKEMLGEGWREKTFRTMKGLPKSRPWLPPQAARRWWEMALEGEAPRAGKLLRALGN